MSKVCSMREAVDLIKSGDFIATSGMLTAGIAEEVFKAIEERFLQTGAPRNLSAIAGPGQGNWKGTAYDHFVHDGLLTRIIDSHLGGCVELGKAINANKIEAYNFPLGVITAMLRNAIRHSPGELTKVGLKTFVDPRVSGGKLNEITTEDLVEVVNFNGEEWLYYKTPKLDIGIIRATTADENGNLSIEDEMLPLDIRLCAMAVKACGGKVIAQVKNVAKAGTIPSRKVEVPGIFVDAVVVSQDPQTNHKQTEEFFYEPSLSGSIVVPESSLEPLPLDERKIIARRAAMELKPNAVVNLGIGMPEGVSRVGAEEGFFDKLVLTSESGIIGGLPCGGLSFGAGRNSWGVLELASQFDFYDGGALDMAFLSFAQIDGSGNVNVSKYGPKVTGCGGFINISQNTPKIIFMGSFTAGGLEIQTGNGTLKIRKEGNTRKFVSQVDQITYSGLLGIENVQDVIFVTERAVFKLVAGGLELVEIAPGIDLVQDILSQMDFKPHVSTELKLMDRSIFEHQPMGCKKYM